MNKIRELISKINCTNDCYNSYFNDQTCEGILEEGYHLSLIKKLLDTISKARNIEMNPGTVLNLSLAILNFTRNKDIQLYFDPYKDEVRGDSLITDRSKIIIFLNDNKLHFHMHSIFKPESYPFYGTILDGYLEEDKIVGTTKENNHEGTFTISFTEDGLLKEKEYSRFINISPCNEWSTTVTRLYSKTTFNENRSKCFEAFFISNETYRTIKENIDLNQNPTNKIITYIPIFMEGYYDLNDKFCIPTINPDSIE